MKVVSKYDKRKTNLILLHSKVYKNHFEQTLYDYTPQLDENGVHLTPDPNWKKHCFIYNGDSYTYVSHYWVEEIYSGSYSLSEVQSSKLKPIIQINHENKNG